MGYMSCVCKITLSIWEQDESCLDCRSGNDSHFSPKLIFSSHTKRQQTKKIPVYRMRGQIYSQSGSRVIRLDAFLEWSFLSLLLSFFEVSPRLPPLPQHSSLLFILYKYNQTGPQLILEYFLSFCWFVLRTHMYEKNTHIRSSRTHGYKGRCWQSVVGPLSG